MEEWQLHVSGFVFVVLCVLRADCVVAGQGFGALAEWSLDSRVAASYGSFVQVLSWCRGKSNYEATYDNW